MRPCARGEGVTSITYAYGEDSQSVNENRNPEATQVEARLASTEPEKKWQCFLPEKIMAIISVRLDPQISLIIQY